MEVKRRNFKRTPYLKINSQIEKEVIITHLELAPIYFDEFGIRFVHQ